MIFQKLQDDTEITPLEIVELIMKDLHHDRDLSALLVPKLRKGCQKFIQLYEEVHASDAEEPDSVAPLSDKAMQRAKTMPFRPKELKSKLRSISSMLDEEDKKMMHGGGSIESPSLKQDKSIVTESLMLHKQTDD